MSDSADARRGAILDAATAVFLRYGFKKTSMDDLARAAGLSRQGLYLHFKTKEELFKAGVLRLIEATRAAGRAVLESNMPLAEQVLEFFVTIHASVGDGSAEHMSELLQATAHLVGDAAQKLEEEQIAALARLLKHIGVAAAWKEAGISATELAEQLFASSHGIKLAMKSRDDYRRKMRLAIELVCYGRSARQRARRASSR